MSVFTTLLSLISLTTIFLWAFYHAHVTDKLFLRIAYIGVGVATSISVMLMFIPIDENFNNRTIVWERLAFAVSIAFYSVADFVREYGTIRFIEAFKNNRPVKRLIDLTRG